ncbi:hypothetical protein BDR05DRAFT_951438 [Suillus weaverae]|nr:hypothetical protein BDR05DRAFT_951438 [Suillus weaverae]
MTFGCEQVMMKHPSAKSISLKKLAMDYGATHFHDALAHYIVQQSQGNDPTPLHGHALDVLAHDIHFPFHQLPVFHKVKWCSVDAHGHGDAHIQYSSGEAGCELEGSLGCVHGLKLDGELAESYKVDGNLDTLAKHGHLQLVLD